LREIFSVFVSFVIFPYCELRWGARLHHVVCTIAVTGNLPYTVHMTTADIETPRPYPGIKQAKLAAAAKAEGDAGKPSADIASIRKGIPPKDFVLMARQIGLPQSELARKLGLSPRTMAARIAGGRKKLSPDETEKVLRIRHIFEHAVRVFGSLKEAREWLMSPASGLEGQRPIDLLDTEPGGAQVRDYLGAIEYGNYW
jgi:putative toxin-antitoxin system antitoxin component (TIGR02293 family)